ncbi:hypothetical protein [Pandoraea terrigena]|uniref:Uncharacterized protein n=1 Tax=Pandoraea terrigena TaxID=2508292 RepID=A0A5E4YA61_9BURK|nr:hypothetical protein [Pandoraea terrigena]VVE45629.1 hypothetical protein PTE31013_04415 [Pandoraea terrigena]
MNPVGAATIRTIPMIPGNERRPLDRPSERFIADLRTVGLRAGGSLRASMVASAVRMRDDNVQRPLPLLSLSNLEVLPEPEPAADFAFFREPLKQNETLLGQWGEAANAGSQSEAWCRFVDDISARFFKGSRKQRVMDALMLCIDVLPPNRRADALACLLADGEEGRAAAEEFWKYIGLDRIPDLDKHRVRELIRQYEIGM